MTDRPALGPLLPCCSLFSRPPARPPPPCWTKNYPGGAAYFDIHSPPFETLYSQVWWAGLDPVPLPRDVVDRFAGGKVREKPPAKHSASASPPRRRRLCLRQPWERRAGPLCCSPVLVELLYRALHLGARGHTTPRHRRGCPCAPEAASVPASTPLVSVLGAC